MALCLKRTESVPKAVRRLARKRIKKALQALECCDEADAVHSVRKDIKQLRSLLRLIRPRLQKNDYRHQIDLLRKAARRLAPLRDAYVKSNALKNLAVACKGHISPATLRCFQRPLRNAFIHEVKKFSRKRTVTAVRRRLCRAGEDFKEIDLKGKEWKAISPGLTESYR